MRFALAPIKAFTNFSINFNVKLTSNKPIDNKL